MRMSRLLAPTLREVPGDAEIASHQLLLRAGFIRRVSPGVYNFLPLMERVVRKVAQIVREEMDRSGAQEIRMPILCPADLWQQSGRWGAYGKEMFRLKNRHERDELLGPTHEEVVTAIAREEVRSYRQLPLNLYQIQTKFRDEIRPRFGLLRGREFLMKDAYSFHADTADLEREYAVMCGTYTSIFNRCGLATRAVESDVGAIGGSAAHEFMVIVDTPGGECDILYSDACDYAANVERAETRVAPPSYTPTDAAREKVHTPAIRTVAEQAAMLGIPVDQIVKTVVTLATWFDGPEGKPRHQAVVAVLRGDLKLNLVKLQNHLGCHELRTASDEEVLAHTGVVPGFVGPFDLPRGAMLVGDRSVETMRDFSTGAGEKDKHYIHASWSDACRPASFADLVQAEAGMPCPRTPGGTLHATKGIEVGNTFKLGTKYSKAMGATFTTAEGGEEPFVMGCYGIGVTRTAQAAAEACHDANGIAWPVAIAPYHLVIIPANAKDESVVAAAEHLYARAPKAGVEAVIDDRDERAGVKFKDADLIGFPYRITVGKALAEGKVEFKPRLAAEVATLPVDTVIEHVAGLVREATSGKQAPARVLA
jgi:prolyl-tRNA synthetase